MYQVFNVQTYRSFPPSSDVERDEPTDIDSSNVWVDHVIVGLSSKVFLPSSVVLWVRYSILCKFKVNINNPKLQTDKRFSFRFLLASYYYLSVKTVFKLSKKTYQSKPIKHVISELIEFVTNEYSSTDIVHISNIVLLKLNISVNYMLLISSISLIHVLNNPNWLTILIVFYVFTC
jgi:hypothetical protein